MEEMLKLIKQVKGGKVLDIATGTGEFIGFMDEFHKIDSIIAIDMDDRFKTHVERFAETFSLTFQVMDALDLKFPNESFDTVCLSNSIHHIADYPQLFEEMTRVLKKNGQIVINEMFCDKLNQAQLSHVLMHHLFASIDTDHKRYHSKTYTKTELENIINQIPGSKHQIVEYCFPNEDVMNDDFIIAQTQRLEKQLEIMRENKEPRIMEYEVYINMIISYIKKHGFASASSLFAVIYK